MVFRWPGECLGRPVNNEGRAVFLASPEGSFGASAGNHRPRVLSFSNCSVVQLVARRGLKKHAQRSSFRAFPASRKERVFPRPAGWPWGVLQAGKRFDAQIQRPSWGVACRRGMNWLLAAVLEEDEGFRVPESGCGGVSWSLYSLATATRGRPFDSNRNPRPFFWPREKIHTFILTFPAAAPSERVQPVR